MSNDLLSITIGACITISKLAHRAIPYDLQISRQYSWHSGIFSEVVFPQAQILFKSPSTRLIDPTSQPELDYLQ